MSWDCCSVNFFIGFRFYSSTSSSDPFKSLVTINGIVSNAVAVYKTPVSEKRAINRDLCDKAGIYTWVNKVNGKAYVGSSVNLSKRITHYFSPGYLSNNASHVIAKAIRKYGLINFELVI